MSFTARRLVAVVVTCNRPEQLKCSLPRWLAAPPEVLCALLLVDNASTDGTADWLEGVSDPRLTVLRLTENRGGAGWPPFSPQSPTRNGRAAPQPCAIPTGRSARSTAP
jgi:hypothetical protein